MKKLIAIAALIAVTTLAHSHSGGCRKDSPAGQCCHAGSQPLHCH